MIHRIITAALIWTAPLSLASATYFDEAGYTELQALLGASTPDGSGVSVLQVEAPFTGGNGYGYRPDVNDPQFTGSPAVSFTFPGVGTPTAVIGHATRVGRYFYGNTMSFTPGITDVTVLGVDLTSSAEDYLAHQGLNSPYFGSAGDQFVAPKDLSAYKVQNHAWVGTTGNTLVDGEVLARLDYMIARDNVLSVVGVPNNGLGSSGDPGTTAPLLSSSYNSLSVGISTGDHAWSTTGHQSPQIVAPNTEFAVSFSMPLVSSAGALLYDAASADHLNMANAQNSVVMRALLLAGATKEEFATWSRTDARPLDDQFGAGELNVSNSYEVLAAGEQTASISQTVSSTGWDLAAISTGESAYYFFDLTSASNVAVSLNWNAEYIPTAGIDYSNMTLQMADLELSLYSVEEGGFLLDLLLQASLSTENLEYLWLQNLAGGRYVIRVDGLDADSTEYGLAWQSTSVPEPNSFVLLALAAVVVVALGRRRVSA